MVLYGPIVLIVSDITRYIGYTLSYILKTIILDGNNYELQYMRNAASLLSLSPICLNRMCTPRYWTIQYFDL